LLDRGFAQAARLRDLGVRQTLHETQGKHPADILRDPGQRSVEEARLLHCDQPTQGVEVSARQHLFQTLRRLVSAGCPEVIDHGAARHGHHPGPHAPPSCVVGRKRDEQLVEDAGGDVLGVVVVGDAPRHVAPDGGMELAVEPAESGLTPPPGQAQQESLPSITQLAREFHSVGPSIPESRRRGIRWSPPEGDTQI